jgi:hypothetical protein
MDPPIGPVNSKDREFPAGISKRAEIQFPGAMAEPAGCELVCLDERRILRLKIRFKKVAYFLKAGKVSVNTPRFTTNPPQLHHDLPSRKQQKSAKPPAKLPFCLSNFFSSIPIEKLRETCSYP